MIVVYDNDLYQQLNVKDKYLSISALPQLTGHLVLLCSLKTKHYFNEFIKELTTHYGHAKNQLKHLVLILVGDNWAPDEQLVFCQVFADEIFQEGFHHTVYKVFSTPQSCQQLEQILLSRDFSQLKSILPSASITLKSFLSFFLQPDFIRQLSSIMGKMPMFREIAHVYAHHQNLLASGENQLLEALINYEGGESHEFLKSTNSLHLKKQCFEKFALNIKSDAPEALIGVLNQYHSVLIQFETFLTSTQGRLSLFASRYIEQFSDKQDDYHQRKLRFSRALNDFLTMPNQQNLIVFFAQLNF